MFLCSSRCSPSEVSWSRCSCRSWRTTEAAWWRQTGLSVKRGERAGEYRFLGHECRERQTNLMGTLWILSLIGDISTDFCRKTPEAGALATNVCNQTRRFQAKVDWRGKSTGCQIFYCKVAKSWRRTQMVRCARRGRLTHITSVRGRKQYLQVGVVDRERRAEETLDNGHHRLCHILL